MEYILNAEQMKCCDQDTIQNIGIPSMVLMERASLSVADAIIERNNRGNILIFCGSGNNGGDGFAIARLLRERGLSVKIVFVGKETSLTQECALQKSICEKMEIPIINDYSHETPDVIVDAIFGIGLSRAITGKYQEVIQWINENKAYTVAVDIPSGICADDGQVMGCAVKADLTVTFQFKKTGQLLYPGAEYTGQLICKDVGIQMPDSVKEKSKQFIYDKTDLSRLPMRFPRSNKGTYGKVLLIAGSEGMCGAAILAARAAYRSGSGLVKIYTSVCNRSVIQTAIPEAMVSCWDEEDSFTGLLSALTWATAVAIGPGLGTGLTQKHILEYTAEHFKGTLVLDADALNLLAEEEEVKRRILNQRCIVTPHIGEMERLSSRPKKELCDHIIEGASDFSAQYKTNCVLKDARTIVSDGIHSYINTTGNNGMACGGSGDALTGIIVSLAAQGISPFEAACLGTWIHGKAGDAARDALGERSMISGDIVTYISDVLNITCKL